MTTRHFGMGFFGRRPFGEDARKKFREDWEKMTDSEKLDFMNKRMEHFGNEHPDNRFSVEAIDARCEEWMKKTPEEKQKQVDEWKEMFMQRHAHMGGLWGDRCAHPHTQEK